MAASRTPAQPPLPAAALSLDDYLPYLINRTGVALATRFGAALRQAGISLQEWRVLAALREHGGQRLTELAARTSIEVSTLSRLVAGLVTAGLVSRQRASDDARAVAIHLSEAGARLTGTLIPPARSLEQDAMAGLDAAEVAQLAALLKRVYDNLTASTDGAAAPNRPGARGSGRKTR